MKGIILAGGLGTRMWSHSLVLNKHIVAVGALPMIEYPLYTLKRVDIFDFGIVTGGEFYTQIKDYLSQTEHSRGVSFNYFI